MEVCIYQNEFKFISRCIEHRLGEVSFDRYLRYQDIQDYLDRLEQVYSNLVDVYNYGQSVEKRDLTYIWISTSKRSNSRPIIFIDAGIHAREWITVAQALYIIHQLVENPSNYYMIERIDWIIVPVANPDGYQYTHRLNRLWRKNRARGQKCDGVDLNRNFDFKWMHADASDNECASTYAGPYPFSEPETVSLSRLIFHYRRRISMYITFHAAAKSILYPWAFTHLYPRNYEELHQLATKAADAIYNHGGVEYKVGSSANALYKHSGSSRDWVYAVAGIQLSFTVELRGSDQRRYRFELYPKDILGVVAEGFAAIRVFHRFIDRKYTSFLSKLKRAFWY